APDVDSDLFGKVAVGDGGRYVGNVANLAGKVAGHEVHVVSEVLPRSRYALHDRLAAQLTLGAHLARHARHFGGEGSELIDHDVDRVFQLQDFAADVDRDLLGKIAVGNCRG